MIKHSENTMSVCTSEYMYNQNQIFLYLCLLAFLSIKMTKKSRMSQKYVFISEENRHSTQIDLKMYIHYIKMVHKFV